MDSRTFWSFHQCRPDKLHFGEWLFADKSLKRIMKKVRHEKLLLGKEDFIYIQWAYFENYKHPEVRRYNLRTYGVLPCSFLEESKPVTKRITGCNNLPHAEPIHLAIIRDYFEENMATEIYHIRYQTAKERKELIQKNQFEGKNGMAAVANDVTSSYSLYALFEHVQGIQEKDPFRFMVLVHNAVFETIEVIDGKTVKSTAKYSYDDLVNRFKWAHGY